MKFYLIICISLIATLATKAQSVADYAEYMQTKGMDPKEYIFEAFKKHDVVILGERDHRDTTQYDFFLDLLADPRFADEVGYVYTEVGVVNQTENANRLIKGSYASHDDFYSAFVRFYRDMDYEILWEKYNASKFIRGLYAINKNLPEEKKITWGLTDRPWDWSKAVYEGGEYSFRTVYDHRDRYMAENFLNMYRAQPLRNGRRKALVLTNQPHADNNKKEAKQGYLIKKELGKQVKTVLMNWYNWYDDPSTLYADGAWDAAFERTGCKPVAVDLHGSPFGRVKDSEYGRWSKVADGMIFYVPFYKFECVIGIPGIFGDDFIEEFKRRQMITSGKTVSDEVARNMQIWYNTRRSVTDDGSEELQMGQLRKQLETSE